ncbi:MAG: DUF1007 family protein [Mesorhizobium sp.]|nr:DUF1007 family protein [Mesorhizobium sp.]
MHRLTHILVLALAAAIGSSAAAKAHPHIWAEARLEVGVTADREVEWLRHVWRFDELFSSTVLFEFDTDRDLKLSAEELEQVASVIHGSLAEFDYFQMVNRDGRRVPMEAPERMIASFDGDSLIVAFESRPAETLRLEGEVDFGVYDPTFFTAIDFYEDDLLMVAGMPDDCQREVIRPDPNEALLQNQDTLTDAFFNEPGGVDYSSLFATRLQLNCQASG